MTVRQVPGDGNCLFHSLSTALSWAEDRVHLDFDENFKGKMMSGDHHDQEDGGHVLDLHVRSKILRQIAVDMLQNPISCGWGQTLRPRKGGASSGVDGSNAGEDERLGPREYCRFWNRARRYRERLLFLQGSEFLRPSELLQMACSQYGITGEEYCKSMRKDGVWGGGPEIVALCNYLKRPIHVFELMTSHPTPKRNRKRMEYENGNDSYNTNTNNNDNVKWEETSEFCFRRMACFGSPKFDYREPLYILSADCRFPDLKPGQQAAAGNHFMVIIPERQGSSSVSLNPAHRGVRVRSGGHPRSTFQKKDILSKYSIVPPPHSPIVKNASSNNKINSSMTNILQGIMVPLKRMFITSIPAAFT